MLTIGCAIKRQPISQRFSLRPTVNGLKFVTFQHLFHLFSPSPGHESRYFVALRAIATVLVVFCILGLIEAKRQLSILNLLGYKLCI